MLPCASVVQDKLLTGASGPSRDISQPLALALCPKTLDSIADQGQDGCVRGHYILVNPATKLLRGSQFVRGAM